jgi:hypothetical protein
MTSLLLFFHPGRILGNGAGFVRVVPEIRGTHRLLQRLDFVFQGRDVKDTS